MEEKNVGSGIEKRRYKRLKVDLKLNVSNLFKQNNVNIRNIDSPITVTDISKSGIGFRSKSILPIDFYFNAAFGSLTPQNPLRPVMVLFFAQI